VSGEDEIRFVPAFGTEDHTAAYRVRNMLLAAGIQAEVCPARQWITAPHYAEVFVEAPWYVMVPDDHAERGRDLAERWQRRFGEA
jgi:hypothetical protein